MFAFLVLVSSLSPVVAGRTQEHMSVTPIQKVIQMLGDMAAKGKQEKNLEEVEFTKFKTWCEDTISDKEKSIADGKSAIEQLNADIMKAESDAKILGEEVVGHNGEVDGWKKDGDNATAIREKEQADYDAAHADYSESIDAIERAIQVLGQKQADIPQSLLQLQQSPLIPERAKAVVASFLEADAGTMAPEANAYESQSGGVIKMLEKLLHKFEDDRFALEKAEMSSKANYEMLMQKLTDQIDQAEHAISSKTEAKAGRLADAADAKGDLEQTSAVLGEDEKIYADTKTECAAKSQEFEKNQVTRADEVKAIEQAIEIMASPAVSGSAEKHLPTLVQKSSLVQLRSSANKDTASQAKAAAFLADKAKSLNSRYLSVLATRAAADPFVKVKKMIKDLIVKLMEEANAEADHKAFCDTELATNKQTRENLSAEVDKLTANVDEKEALKAQLATSIKELSDSIAEIKAQQAEAVALRADEKARNAATVEDATAGQTAVEQALKVLKDFYAGAALLQVRTREPYKGQQDESTGVIGFLEVILSDFARLESETSSAEDTSQAAHEKFMAESQQDAEVKQAEVDHKTLKKQQTEEALADLKKNLEDTQVELQTSLDYYEKLKPQCVDMNLSYEDRVAKRKEEIVSLQEALRILSGEEIA